MVDNHQVTLANPSRTETYDKQMAPRKKDRTTGVWPMTCTPRHDFWLHRRFLHSYGRIHAIQQRCQEILSRIMLLLWVARQKFLFLAMHTGAKPKTQKKEQLRPRDSVGPISLKGPRYCHGVHFRESEKVIPNIEKLILYYTGT